jgi:hypothetical protein
MSSTVLIPASTSGNTVALSAEQSVDQSLAIVHVPAALVNNVATPTSPTAPLPTYNPGKAVTAEGGTVGVGGTAQSLFGGTVPVNGYLVSNLHTTEVMYLNDAGVATTTGASVPVPPMVTFVTPSGYKPPGAVSLMAATTGHAYSARRW